MDKWVPGYNAYLDQNKQQKSFKKKKKKKKNPQR